MVKPKQAPLYVEGLLQLKAKFGFVLSEDPALGDVMVDGPTLKLAMNGDRVRARVVSEPDAIRRCGVITDILVHSRTTAVGTFRRVGHVPALVPENEGAPVTLVDLQSFVPHVGDVVAARILRWPTEQNAAEGVLTQVLGPRDSPGVDLKALVLKHELPDGFTLDVVKEAEAFGDQVPETVWKSRENFFKQRVFTIDGADAKDFDDAVSLEHIPGGWRLAVHIADVAHYVREGTALDQEAYRRGTSVYLSGTVLPMLPFPLSDNLCSLRPERVRLTLSCVMDINRDAHVVSARVVESAIKSDRRFTYEEVETILKGGMPERVTPEIAADVKEMGALARMLRAKRFERGSLDFDFPEPEVVNDAKGRPVDIRRRNRLESHRLIEDFMLLANEAVARHMQSHPFLYRIHETPEPAKMEKLRKSLEILGLRLPGHMDPAHPQALQQVIKASESLPYPGMVHVMILRSLRQAVYSPVNKGHYGLASKCYTHFTSPIRRYPDLIVHRILKDYLKGHPRDDYWNKELPMITAHTSRRERLAVDAEREYLDLQKVRLMESRVGDTFTGIISSVTNFGFFVQLDEFFVEGLVHVTMLGNDYFVFDEARMILRGRRSNQTYAMGNKVTVKLAAAHVLKRQLDFQLITSAKPASPKSHPMPPKIPGPRQNQRRRRNRRPR